MGNKKQGLSGPKKLPENALRKAIGLFGQELGLSILGGEALGQFDKRGDLFVSELGGYVEVKMASNRQPVQLPEDQIRRHHQESVELGHRHFYLVARYKNAFTDDDGRRVSRMKKMCLTQVDVYRFLHANLRELFFIETSVIQKVLDTQGGRHRRVMTRQKIDEPVVRVPVGDLLGLTTGHPVTMAKFGLLPEQYSWGTGVVKGKVSGFEEVELPLHRLTVSSPAQEDASLDVQALEATGTESAHTPA